MKKTKSTKATPKSVYAFGYIKPERDGFVAICVNLSLFAQAKTVDGAIKKLIKATEVYLNHIVEHHPDELEKHLDRPVPKSIMKEFMKLYDDVIQSVEKEKHTRRLIKDHIERASKQPLNRSLKMMTFGTQVSSTYAQTSA